VTFRTLADEAALYRGGGLATAEGGVFVDRLRGLFKRSHDPTRLVDSIWVAPNRSYLALSVDLRNDGQDWPEAELPFLASKLDTYLTFASGPGIVNELGAGAADLPVVVAVMCYQEPSGPLGALLSSKQPEFAARRIRLAYLTEGLHDVPPPP
jgi:hypothetical protein